VRAVVSEIEIVGAEGFEQLVALQGLNEQIFGIGQRTPGWFRRKLIREGVEARLSGIAIDRASDQPCGHVLVGTAASLGNSVRGSVVAVTTAVRGRGIGRALIDFADARAHACGFEQLEFLCEGERLDWYLRQGFVVVERQLSLCASGLGPRDEVQVGVAIDAPPLGRDPLWTWLPEIWLRTPTPERAYIELDAPGGVVAKIWLTREGRAWLAQRLELDWSSTGDPGDPTEALVHVIGQLRREVATGTPLLLYPCTADTRTAEVLASAGFTPVQRSFLLGRPTGHYSLDNAPASARPCAPT
jgi:GNAT superfamily N-acetyltransferase